MSNNEELEGMYHMCIFFFLGLEFGWMDIGKGERRRASCLLAWEVCNIMEHFRIAWHGVLGRKEGIDTHYSS